MWPLTGQLKKDAFCWNEAAEEAFPRLKLAMTTVRILAFLYFTKLCGRSGCIQPWVRHCPYAGAVTK